MSNFQATIKLTDSFSATVSDGQLHVYEPGGEGDSEPISAQTVQRLEHLLATVRLEHGVHPCPR